MSDLPKLWQSCAICAVHVTENLQAFGMTPFHLVDDQTRLRSFDRLTVIDNSGGTVCRDALKEQVGVNCPGICRHSAAAFRVSLFVLYR